MNAFASELRQAARALFARPAFLLTAVLTMTLGIGALAAIFAVYDAVLLKPLPFADADRLVRLTREQPPVQLGTLSVPSFNAWHDGGGAAFEAMGAYYSDTRNLVGNGDALRVTAYLASPGFWEVFRHPLALGRGFGADEENRAERVVVLSDALWRDRFAAAADVIGRDIELGGESFRVIGVAQPDFRYPSDAQVWIPTFFPSNAYRDKRGAHFLRVVARMRDGVSMQQAAAVMKGVTDEEARRFPAEDAGIGTGIVPLQQLVAGDLHQPLRMLLIAAALVLLIACANLANLMLARGQAREQDIAVRRALGAGQARLGRQVLAEALLIALLGAAAGFAIARPAVSALLALAPDLLPAYNHPNVDLRVIAVTTAIALATLLLFGLLPAWRAAAVDPMHALRGSSRSHTGGRAQTRLRAVLVSAEVALAMTLLAGAVLLVDSLRRVSAVDSGVASAQVLTAQFSLVIPVAQPGEALDDWAARSIQVLGPRLQAIQARLRELPGVESVAISDRLPASGEWGWNGGFEVVGQPNNDKAALEYRFVSEDYFRTFGIAVDNGHAFGAAEAMPPLYPTQILVNRTFADRYLHGDPLSREVNTFGSPTPLRVIGVVADVRQAGLDRPANPEAYFPVVTSIKGNLAVAIKVSGNALGHAAALRQAMREVAPDAPVYAVRTMAEVTSETLRLRRFNGLLMSVFAGLAVALAAIGLYGVVAYAASLRRREIGLRRALGANGVAIHRLMLGAGLRMVVPGLLVGAAGALALGRMIASQLYDVSPTDPRVLGVVAALLGLVAIAACAIPTWRAARVSPLEALRDE